MLNDSSSLVTLFAAPDTAFNASFVAHLQDPASKAELNTFLHVHCAFGDILSAALKPTQQIENEAGSTLTITRSPQNVVEVEGIIVVIKDIIAANGVMDVLEKDFVPAAPQPGHPTPAPASPTPEPSPIGYDCTFPDLQCRPVGPAGQYKNVSACKQACQYPTPAPPPPPTPPSKKTHYGDPKNGCLPDERNVNVTGVAGDFCSPTRTLARACPTDIPAGVTARPECALQSSAGGSTVKYCALICSASYTYSGSIEAQKAADADAQCGAGASCKSIQSTGICTYDGSDVNSVWAFKTSSSDFDSAKKKHIGRSAVAGDSGTCGGIGTRAPR
jgi:hypothetical protein